MRDPEVHLDSARNAADAGQATEPAWSLPAASLAAHGEPLDEPAAERDAEADAEHEADAAADAEGQAGADTGTPRRWSARTVAGWIAAAALVLLAGGYLVDLLSSSGEIERGTSIGGVDVGGLTPAEAVATLGEQFAETAQPVEITAQDETYLLDPVQAGLTVRLDESVAAAGVRSANPFVRIGHWFGGSSALPLSAAVDDPALTASLTALAGQIAIAPVEGQVSVNGTTVDVVAPVNGRALDIPAAAAAVTSVWTGGDPRALSGTALPVTVQPVRASAAATEQAAAQARAVLTGPLTVQANGVALAVPVEQLAAALAITPDQADGFAVTVDTALVKSAFQPAVDATQIQPVNAAVAIVDGAPQVTPGQDGLTVDWPATDAALDAALSAPEHLLTVVYTRTPPAVTTESMQALGIKEPVAEFTTGGFAYDSGQNVKRVAEQVQGAIVLPGETFSLNGYTGKRGVDEGYVEAGIIQDGVPSRAVGGGISQFATTLFNAGYFAGMEDVEHKSHSYYISRYPAGREATVFENPDGTSVIDVKFRNVYPTAILIQTEWTESDITVRIWGTKTVEVESISGERYNITSAPTKTIPYGQSCSASGGSTGFSIDDTRVIRDLAGTELSRETTTTIYNGQVRVTCEPPPAPAPDPAAETPAAGG